MKVRKGKMLKIFVGESDRYHGKSLFELIVKEIREEGLSGATVIRGIEGFGKSSNIHTTHILRLSERLPILIEVIDTNEKIDELLHVLKKYLNMGMFVTLDNINIIEKIED
ncbi:DUF190 domain-containing protein [Helicovermis profundi]|uniref:DUF190 domain-containing protein n=1 Tax=Helicovermis profundi TaxID=3065157 RepID=A0AAU9EGT0_9FIRM|nr:DUF190 domain-containing protein [Clostridia bacterium S502]